MRLAPIRRLAAFGLLLAAGCRPVLPPPSATAYPATASPSAAIVPNGTPSLAPVSPQEWLHQHLEQVSQKRLMSDVTALSAIPTRHVNSPGIAVAAGYIADAFAAAGVLLGPDIFALGFRGQSTDQANVVASIDGSDPTAGAILLGAHYDSRTTDIGDWLSAAPGANDNATGVAVLLEVGRLLADFHPKATIYLVAFPAEETGLQGSRHFVESGQASDVRAMVAFDIVGNSSGPGGPSALRVFSPGPEDSPSRQLARSMAASAGRWTPGLPLLIQDALDRPGRYSDHVPFIEAGIPAARLIEDAEHTELQHNAQDTPDRVDPAYLHRVAQLALAVAVELSEDPPTSRQE